MRFLALLLLLLPTLFRGESEHLFPNEENPNLFHHVNVITGNLNLFITDTIVQGAVPIPICRNYSSSFAKDPYSDSSDILFCVGNNIVQGGWNFLPHGIMRVIPSKKKENYVIYSSDAKGNRIKYLFSHKDPQNKDAFFLKSTDPFYQISGQLGARTNPKNNLLWIDIKKGEAKLYSSDGSSKTYSGTATHKYREGTFHYFMLEEELPNKQKIRFQYTPRGFAHRILDKISAVNPSGTKTFSQVQFKVPPTGLSYIEQTTTDNKKIIYNFDKYENYKYLSLINNPYSKTESSVFQECRPGYKHKLNSLKWGGCEQFKVYYYNPSGDRAVKQLFGLESVDISDDKVYLIQAPIGPNDEMLSLANFSYFSDHTDVRDAEKLLTRYYHDSSRLLKIEYFDKADQLHSRQKFYWSGSHLICKAMEDKNGKPIFAKTFVFDTNGNVSEESLWGNITGDASDLVISENGCPSGAEAFTKRYSYYPGSNLLFTEEQANGPTYRYYYKDGTDLLIKKLTCEGSKILIREFYEYDDDHLLIAEIIDDGSQENSDLDSFSQRMIKRYERDPATGLIKSFKEAYYDLDTHTEKQLMRVEIAYNSNILIETETVYDAKNERRYCVTTKYDLHGNIISKTTPLGNENTYRYDEFDQLLEIKEVGSPKKIFTYDKAGRQKTCEEPDLNKKTLFSTDAKGRVLSKNENGNQTNQVFDAFGLCRETHFPENKSHIGENRRPIVAFEYDLSGNLTVVQTPKGEESRTSYSVLRKPIRILQPDQNEITHTYNLNGSLISTTFPDQTTVHYTYDLFQRKTSETIVGKTGEVLSTEKWDYDSFHLISRTDRQGLTTYYSYDPAGRKILETAGEFQRRFFYDELGFLEKTSQGGISHVEKRNVGGLIEECWEEDHCGCKENHMRFFYNAEEKKEKVVRKTSQGDAVDLFTYHPDGALKTHTDPEGNITSFLYNYFYKNDLGQNVLQKQVIDPAGNAVIETYDANSKLVSCKKLSSENEVTFKEEYFYDVSGNRARRESTVFAKGKPPRKTITSWRHDSMGRITQQTEGDKKTTRYEYDENGRLHIKILPSGDFLQYKYDGLGRLIQTYGSDGSVDFEYGDFTGENPKKIIDNVQGMIIDRKYNLFGQLLEESNSHGRIQQWQYDSLGRCTSIILPDRSSIQYDFSGLHLKTVTRCTPDHRALYNHVYRAFDLNGHVREEDLILNLGTIKTRRDLLERPLNQMSPWLHHSVSYNSLSFVEKIQNSLFGEKQCKYDPLGQLTQAGAEEYAFDSLGNPLDFEVDDCNQIISEVSGYTIEYDLNGNPAERIYPNKTITYKYDLLGRLVEIIDAAHKKIVYIYDPFSRLDSKEVYTHKNGAWVQETKTFFLYDQDKEIGLLDQNGDILQLKVLGLGMKGDIGAAVALELEGEIYAPLHDFTGSIIAILSAEGKIVESYDLDPFGREDSQSLPKNPWRFSSKRHEEGFVFFGLRFYDPNLQRWLTPDPAGFVDGSNLYAFVLNNPLNRLDLFGLSSENFLVDLKLEVPIQSLGNMTKPLTITCSINGVNIDCIIFCGFMHKLQFTPEEQALGKVDLAKHFTELMPKEGAIIGFRTSAQGINTPLKDYQRMCNFDVGLVPEGTLFVGPHFPSEGFGQGFRDMGKDMMNIETTESSLNAQFLIAILERIDSINPSLLCDYVAHSRGSSKFCYAYGRMSEEIKELVQQHILYTGLGGVMPVPVEFAYEAVNIYSLKDRAAMPYGDWWVKARGPNILHNVQKIPCESSIFEYSGLYADHARLGTTYKNATKERTQDLRNKYGYFKGNKR